MKKSPKEARTCPFIELFELLYRIDKRNKRQVSHPEEGQYVTQEYLKKAVNKDNDRR